MIVIIPAVFYAYTAFTEEILAVDIATFMVAVIVGQIINYKLLNKGKPSERIEIVAIIVIALLAIIFVTFTFYPPPLSIFQDSSTGQYGIASS
jgi:fucose permease